MQSRFSWPIPFGRSIRSFLFPALTDIFDDAGPSSLYITVGFNSYLLGTEKSHSLRSFFHTNLSIHIFIENTQGGIRDANSVLPRTRTL